MNVGDAKNVQIEFAQLMIEEIPNQISVHGKCYEGPIRINDAFTLTYKITSSRDLNGNFVHRKETPMPISLKVRKIISYGKEMDELSPSMSGQLILAGTGKENIQDDFVLGTEATFRRDPNAPLPI